jgi:hypothetical protein
MLAEGGMARPLVTFSGSSSEQPEIKQAMLSKSLFLFVLRA